MSNYALRLIKIDNINPLQTLIKLQIDVKKNTSIEHSKKQDILLRIDQKILEYVEYLYRRFSRHYTFINNLPIGEYQNLINALNSINLTKFENSKRSNIKELKNNISANISRQQNKNKEKSKYENKEYKKEEYKYKNNNKIENK